LTGFSEVRQGFIGNSSELARVALLGREHIHTRSGVFDFEPGAENPGGSGEHDAHTPVFMPLRPTPRGRMIFRAIAGALIWLIALVIALITLDRTQDIERGLLIAAASFAVSMIVLFVLLAIRRYKERRDVSR
jgi:hypothetical protein